MAGRRSMIFDILADSSKAKKEFDAFEDKALGVAASITAAYAGAKLVQGIDDALVSEKAGAKVAAQLDLIPAAAQRASDAANAAFRDGMGESLEDVSRAVFEVGEDMVDLNATSEASTQKMVTDALAIADAYDKDVSEVTRAAGQLMKNGLAKDADEAFDIITAGMQGGLDKTDEFLDTLWEYGEPLGQLGLTGTDALAMFGSALDAGAFSVDKAGDAINEFATRSIDGSDATAAAYESLGLNAEQMTNMIAMGGPAAKTAFSQVVSALGGMDDAVAQDAAGVALFGSMWEDAGKGMVLAMDPAQQQIEDVTDATEDMSDVMYDNATDKAASMRRSFQGWFQDMVAIPGPLGNVAAMTQAFGGDLIAAGGAVGSMAIGLRGLGLVQKAQAVWTGIVTAAQWAWNAAMNANPIGLIIIAITALVAGIVWAWNNVDWFREGLLSAWQWIQDAWSQVGPFFSELGDRIGAVFSWVWGVIKKVWSYTPLGMIIGNWDKITGFFGTVRDRIGRFFSATWDVIKKVWSYTPLGMITSNWGAILDFFKSIPSKIGSFFSGLANTISRPFKSAFNGVAGAWNGSVAKLSWTAPDWIPFVGGKTISVPKIPMLAQGGIATAATLAMIGEGREEEVVAPLSQLDRYMRSAGYGGSGDGGSTVVSLAGAEIVVVDADGALVGRMRTEARQEISGERRAQRVAARGRN